MRIAQTKRTDIELICLEDAPFFLELLNSPLWLHYIGDRQVHDINSAENFLRNGFLKTYEQHGYSYYVIRTKDCQSIGICGFLRKPYLEYEDFGFAFLPEYHGQGYAYEAGRAILDFGIQQFGFQTLDAVTMPTNAPSIGLLEKFGFTFERLIQTPDSNEELMLYRWNST